MWAAKSLRFVSVPSFIWGSTTTKDEQRTCPIQVTVPQSSESGVLLSRKIINHLDKSGLNLRLYQYETCPFCCKVRAFLDYYGFSYEVVEVNPVTRSQIKFSKTYKKVPILKSNDEFMNESSLIISQLSTYLQRPDRSFSDVVNMYPSIETTDEKGKKTQLHPNKFFIMLENVGSVEQMAAAKEEREWREWVDNWFIHLISPNVYRSWDEALETFKWFEKVGDWQRNFPAWERVLAVYIGAMAMFLLSKRLKKRHGIEDERVALQDACDEWMRAIGPNRPFLGGDKPNIADISLFGAMNSFYGCAAFKDVVLQGKIASWWERMKQAVNNHEGRKALEVRVNHNK